MHRSSFKLLVAIGLVSSAGACGDDESTNGQASGTSTGDTDTSPSTMSGSGTMSTSSGNTDTATGEGSGSSSGDPGDTDPSSGGTTVDTDSATESDTESATESDTDSATMGSSSGVEESGDDQGTTGGEAEFCEAPGMVTPCDEGTANPFQAIGLGCTGEDPNTFIPIVNESFTSNDADAWKIARQFGTYINPATAQPQWAPREGASFLLITTGVLNDPDAAGIVSAAAGSTQGGTSNGNPDFIGAAGLPAPFSPSEGSNNGAGGTPFINCDGVNDCSDSLWGQWTFGGSQANDLLWFQFETPVPGGTNGFSFDFAYFSAEFPEYVDDIYNDIFAVWSSSETYTGNLCFVNDEPCTVTALGPSVEYDGADDPQLQGTGFDGYDFFNDAGYGQSTDWFNAKGSAEPGEDLQLTFVLFDMGDTIYDTTVILDNFQWDCEGCVPSEVDPCIGIDPV